MQDALLEKLEILQNILISRAQYKHQASDEEEYRNLRAELIADVNLGENLPRFVRTCRFLSEFWDHIKSNNLPTYQSRRTYIREQFRQAFGKLEGNLQAASLPVPLSEELGCGGDTGITMLESYDEIGKGPHSPNGVREPIDIFFSYAHEDEELMHDVRRQFVLFERLGLIRKWWDRKIEAGAVWADKIDENLKRSRIVLLLLSPHFLDSDYCYETEMRVAMDRHESGEAVVIPVILRPCAWQSAPFARLQALPTDGKPVTNWSDRDQACLDIAQGVMRVARSLN